MQCIRMDNCQRKDIITEEGEEMLSLIGDERFSHDGLSPKLVLRQDGTRYEPMSRLFLIYNYAKYYAYHGMASE